MELLQSPITLVLLAANILLSTMAFQNDAFMKKNLFVIGPILQRREYHRLFSSGFLHLNLIHLFINMWVLFQIGGALERVMGSVHFTALYAFSLLGGSLWSLMENRKNLLYSALGASGATSGLVIAFCFFAPNAWFTFPPLPAWALAIAYFGITAWLSRLPNQRIGHDAHMGGMLFGGVYVLFYEPRLWGRFIPTIAQTIGLA